nr:DUF3558 domain-containing protein [Amycolatopsis benzoatilytica]
MVAGCSGGSAAGHASAAVEAATSSAPPAKTLPYAGAPKVQDPLPDSVVSGHPCDGALTSAQVEKLLSKELPGDHDDQAALGPQCHWINSDVGAGVSVLYATKVSDGLSAVYSNTKPQATVWRPLPLIMGLPAVAHSTYGNGGSKSFCQISVGISDRQVVAISVNLSPAKVSSNTDPCEAAGKAADMVIGNLKQKAGS